MEFSRMDAVLIARNYLKRGWAPIPVPYREKGPKVPGWQKLVISEDQLGLYFAERSNVGVLNGRLSNWLIDIDLDHPAAVKLASKYLPPTGSIFGRAGKRASHWLYHVTEPASTLKLSAHDAEGEVHTIVEIRATGQTVFPGSVHESGELIEWESDSEPAEIGPLELIKAVRALYAAAMLEAGLSEFKAEPEYTRPVGHSPRERVGAKRPGDDFNDRGNVADLLRKHGWSFVRDDGEATRWRRPGKATGISASLKDGAFYVFTSSTQFQSEKAYSPYAVLTYLEHAGNFEDCASRLAAEGYGDSMPADPIGHQLAAKLLEHTEPPPVSSRPKLPSQAMQPGGLLQDLLDYSLRTALHPQPALSLAGVIAVAGTILGRRVRDSRNTRTNVYCMAIAPSGSGKEHPRKINKQLLHGIGAAEACGPEGVASSAGLVQAVYSCPSMLLQVDEIGHLLSACQNRNAGHLYKISSELMKLYSSSDSVWIGDAYADAKHVKTINQPNLCVYGTTTPAAIYEGGMTSRTMVDGFMGRMLIFRPDLDRVPERDIEPEPIPSAVLDGFRAWWEYLPGDGNLLSWTPAPVLVRHTERAVKRYREHRDQIFDKHTGEDEQDIAIWSRAKEKTGKLALIHACLQGPPRPEIEIDLSSLDWAISVSNYSCRLLNYEVSRHIIESKSQANIQFVLSRIKSGMTLRDLKRSARRLSAKEMQEAVLAIEEDGLAVFDTVNTGGRSSVVIKLPDK